QRALYPTRSSLSPRPALPCPAQPNDEGGFKRPPGSDRGQAGGGGGGVRLGSGALSPPPAASSGDPRPLTPGAQGLKNHGNTCFLNAVVQCLSHTELLAAFLLLALPEPPSPARPGSKAATGEVTRHLAALVRALWTLEYTPQLSADFKVGSTGGEEGRAIQAYLDCSIPMLGPRVKDCSLSVGKLRRESLMPKCSSTSGSAQATVQSSLTCPHCRKQSNTFDPFLCISLPIPLRQTRPLNVTLVFQSKSQRFVRVGLAVPLFSTVSKLREMVAEEGKISPDQVILVELNQSGFQCSFSDDEDLNSIAEGDNIYAFQSFPSSPNSAEPEGQRLVHNGAMSSEFLNHGGGGRILLLICNLAGTGQQAVRFGPPLLMREDRAMSWEQLQQCILGKMCYLMRREAQASGSLFQVRVVGGSSLCSYLSSQDRWPLYHPAVDRALQFGGPGGPVHVKLVVEWDLTIKESLFGNIQEEVVEDAESVRLKQQLHQQQHSCTLNECFQLYTKEEQLAPDDAWRCPHCQVLQQGMVKLSLWTLPDILIIHLKRFRQVGEQRHKLSTLVHFPLRGLDMAPHVAKRSRGSKWGPWKQSLTEEGHCTFLYDLYAVCNHHGSLHGGHYTAYCYNSLDGRWYSYDDSTVEPVMEEDISTRGAYILFYQRRNVVPSWPAGSSVRGSTSSSISEHWLTRLSRSGKRESLVSWSSTTCPSLPKSSHSPTLISASTSQEKGGFESRPLVRGVQGRSVSLKASSNKAKLGIPKTLPLRWSFTSKDWPAEPSRELVDYLESGRRPWFTKESIVPLITKEGEDNEVTVTKANPALTSMGPAETTGKATTAMENLNTLKRVGKPKEETGEQPRTPKKLVLSLSTVPPVKDEEPKTKANTNGTLRIGSNMTSSNWGDAEQKTGPWLREKETEMRNNQRGSWHRTNNTLNPRSTEGLPNGRISRSEVDIKRAQSSCSSKGRNDWLLSRSTSLCKANNGALQASMPPLPLEGISCGTFQRARYHTASLGRRIIVPESSF
uniref:ubiquitinyl hydrolase 1 n=1 Tax=Naja naja TaxID=35670 RepID=A0A8C6YGA4_NAJNA